MAISIVMISILRKIEDGYIQLKVELYINIDNLGTEGT